MRWSCEISPALADLAAGAMPEAVTPLDGVESFAYRFGRSYDAYLAAEPDRSHFWSRDRRGVVAYLRVGKYLNVGGGLLANAADRETLLAEFVEFADRHRWFPSFYNVAEAELPLFRQYGFQATKWGEEAIIDLQHRNWRGGEYAWVRRQSSFCRRHGVDMAECVPDSLPRKEWSQVQAQLREISADFLAAKPQASELRFLDGSLDLQNLCRRRLFVARQGGAAGRVEGFLVCNPYCDGRGWAFEIYRQRPDAVRGTIPFLMHRTMQMLQEEGLEQVSLCLAPGLRASEPLPGDSALVRGGLAIGSRYFSFIFDAAGLYHFKSRFRPRFENRYLCVRPKATLGSTWALVQLLGVLKLDLRKLGRSLLDRARKAGSRSTLASPAE
jgi:phosphatidylglycerol lysyltransferase